MFFRIVSLSMVASLAPQDSLALMLSASHQLVIKSTQKSARAPRYVSEFDRSNASDFLVTGARSRLHKRSRSAPMDAGKSFATKKQHSRSRSAPSTDAYDLEQIGNPAYFEEWLQQSAQPTVVPGGDLGESQFSNPEADFETWYEGEFGGAFADGLLTPPPEGEDDSPENSGTHEEAAAPTPTLNTLGMDLKAFLHALEQARAAGATEPHANAAAKAAVAAKESLVLKRDPEERKPTPLVREEGIRNSIPRIMGISEENDYYTRFLFNRQHGRRAMCDRSVRRLKIDDIRSYKGNSAAPK